MLAKVLSCAIVGLEGAIVEVEVEVDISPGLPQFTIVQERYENYMKMNKESEFNEMSYLEKRQKDKDFGKMIKTAKKQLKLRKKQ